MNVFLVTYDLNKPVQQYEKFYGVLKRFAWAKLSESCYAISTNETPATLLQMFRQYLDANDTIYIIALTYPYIGFGPPEVNDWLALGL